MNPLNPLLIVFIGVAVVVGGILLLRLHAFLSLIAGAMVVALLSPMKQAIGEQIAAGFGDQAKNVGILIAMAAVLGKALMDSGAAERIVLSLREAMGEGQVALAFLISGFVMAALVLSDTTFYLLIPLARATSARSGRHYLLYILAIVAGAVMAHSLVPPAAGPAMVATSLHVKLGTMMLGGAIVGGIASTSGYLYALWANRKWQIPLRDALGVSAIELARVTEQPESSLPPLWLAILPIALPILLITLGDVRPSNAVFKSLGNANVALTLAAAIGLAMMAIRGEGMTRKQFTTAVGQALASAGVMVLIISAGGSFGWVVKNTGVDVEIRRNLPAARLAILPLAFLVTSALRTAQGSAIVAMTSALAVVSPLAAAGTLGFHPVYLALAIGCGSKPIPWMNDAGFWIIGQTSGMTEAETLKTVSVMMTIMGVTGLAATVLGAWIFPLAGVH
jgi:GntP family gluconate:H+ symporter